MIRIHSTIEHIAATILVVVAFWNIWEFNRNVADLPRRDNNEPEIEEMRYHDIRQTLNSIGYGKGPIGFITNRDLKGEPESLQDRARWAYGQYVMVPWILVRNQRALSNVAVNADPRFIIADFWDAKPGEIPPDLIKLYDSGKGLILFERKPAP